MAQQRTWISIGDFVDVLYKFRQKGLRILAPFLNVSDVARTASKWNSEFVTADSWILPEIRQRWNADCTGDPGMEYEDYVMLHFLRDRKDLNMLSVGCGTGLRERKFGKYPQFKRIVGIDIASTSIQEARDEAKKANFFHLDYYIGDFTKQVFESKTFDVILFNSSLHHFHNIDSLLQQQVMTLMKEDGVLILFEYVGPNRLQWTNEQLRKANEVLCELPEHLRVRFQSNSIKRHTYRPGLWRMKLNDPSEAPDAENLLAAVHHHFDIVIERRVMYNIAHLVLKDIAHHFLNGDDEAKKWLSFILQQEDAFCESTGERDLVFGVYRRKPG